MSSMVSFVQDRSVSLNEGEPQPLFEVAHVWIPQKNNHKGEQTNTPGLAAEDTDCPSHPIYADSVQSYIGVALTISMNIIM